MFKCSEILENRSPLSRTVIYPSGKRGVDISEARLSQKKFSFPAEEIGKISWDKI